MDIPKDGKQVWHIVFTQTNDTHWIFRWIHKKKQHCYVVKESLGGMFWIVINGRRSHLDVETYSKDYYPRLMDMLGEGDHVMTVITEYDVNLRNHQLSVISCTDVVKRCLGITDWLCWTPNQLYKRIKRGKYEQRIKTGRESRKESSAGAGEATEGAATERGVASC